MKMLKGGMGGEIGNSYLLRATMNYRSIINILSIGQEFIGVYDATCLHNNTVFNALIQTL